MNSSGIMRAAASNSCPACTCPPPKDPCNQKIVLNNRFTNTAATTNNAQSINGGFTALEGKLSEPNEWGTPIVAKLQDGSGLSVPPSYFYTNPLNSNDVEHYNFTAMWNLSTGDVTCGSIHSHLEGDGYIDCFSVDDVFQMHFFTELYFASDNSTRREFLNDNVMIMVVGQDANYMITVKDWVGLNQILTTENAVTIQSVLNDKYHYDNYNYQAAFLEKFG